MPAHLSSRRDIAEVPQHRIASWALVPLRLFLGGTFLYAGLDKLLDPSFLAASGIGSIGEQLHAFVRTSPLAPFVQALALPQPILIGLGMSLLEIAIGLGALSGWLFRASAAAGAAVAILFWLTASWSTTPYFLGADLPYAAGWLTLALAGDGGAWTVPGWLAARRAIVAGARRHWTRQEPVSPERRVFLQVAMLAGAAVLVGGPSLILGRLIAASRHAAAAEAPSSAVQTVGGSSTSAGAASAEPTPTPSGKEGTLLARGSDLAASGSVTTLDPQSGDPVIVIRLPAGSVVAYDAVCTHAGCTVEYDASTVTLFCPCHGASFDPRQHAWVLGGPTFEPLSQVAVRVDTSSGDVRLAS
jgi:thiosulfate dehydrogenase [quinone] large subunit